MGVQTRGGIPRVKQGLSITTSGRKVPFEALSTHVIVRTATNPVRLFFSKADYEADVNYWEVAVGEANKFDAPLEAREIYMKGNGGTATVDLIVFHRKG